MNMYEIEEKMEYEINEERAEFAKNFLKQKRIEIKRLDKQFGELAAKIEKAEEEYDEILDMSVDEVYDKYNFPTGGIITGNIACHFHDPNIWKQLED